MITEHVGLRDALRARGEAFLSDAELPAVFAAVQASSCDALLTEALASAETRSGAALRAAVQRYRDFSGATLEQVTADVVLPHDLLTHDRLSIIARAGQVADCLEHHAQENPSTDEDDRAGGRLALALGYALTSSLVAFDLAALANAAEDPADREEARRSSRLLFDSAFAILRRSTAAAQDDACCLGLLVGCAARLAALREAAHPAGPVAAPAALEAGSVYTDDIVLAHHFAIRTGYWRDAMATSPVWRAARGHFCRLTRGDAAGTAVRLTRGMRHQGFGRLRAWARGI